MNMAKRIKDTTAWRRTPEGTTKYHAAYEQAQAQANASGRDMGIEANDLFKEFRVFGLPSRENRSGHELRCEVVSCQTFLKIAPGHGPR